MHKHFHHTALGLLACTAFALPASAQVVEMLARLDGGQEIPTNPSTAKGIGVFSVDTVTGNVDYRITFAGLGSAETDAHIHGFAGPGVSAGVLHQLPLGNPKCGSFTLPAGFVPIFLGGLAYVNIHSANFPNGEIRGQISEVESQPTFCHGDGAGLGGALVPCPCGNHSTPGDNEGCSSSFGVGARLVAYGSASISADTVVLHYLRGPSNSSVLFFQGTTAVMAGLGAPFGDGLRCVGGNVVRLALRTPCGGQMALPEPGDASVSVIGGIASPGMRLYQAWYRNSAAFCTNDTFNLSNAVSVDWTP